MQATLTQTITQPLEVYTTAHGAVYQCDASRCWYVNFAGKNARFDYRCLMKLRKAIYHINIEEKLLQTDKSPDVEIVFICACDHTYVLSLLQIIAFKELLEGTFTMLELNRILHTRLYSICA